MSLQSSMPPLQQGALQQAQAAAQRAQAAAVQRARDTLDLCTMYSLQAQAAAKKAKVAAVQHARDGLAITTTTLHKGLWACQRVLKEGCSCNRCAELATKLANGSLLVATLAQHSFFFFEE